MSPDESYQRYLLLSSQQATLRRRLSLHSPTVSPTGQSVPEDASLHCLPTGYTPRSSYSLSYVASPSSPSHPLIAAHPTPAMPDPQKRRSSCVGGPSYPNESDDSKALYEINQQIKAVLTELLNADSVKHNAKFRAWIQSRLMDAEMELKRQRRRRSSASADCKELAESVAEHLDSHHPSLRWSSTF